MNENRKKDFDAVGMMREIRDDLSQKLMNMSHEEQRRYVAEQLEDHDSEKRSPPQRRSTA